MAREIPVSTRWLPCELHNLKWFEMPTYGDNYLDDRVLAAGEWVFDPRGPYAGKILIVDENRVVVEWHKAEDNIFNWTYFLNYQTPALLSFYYADPLEQS